MIERKKNYNIVYQQESMALIYICTYNFFQDRSKIWQNGLKYKY